MQDQEKSKAELIQELNSLKQQINGLEQANRVLQKAVTRYKTIFDLAPIGINISMPNGKLIQTNQKLQEILGYSEQELLGMQFQDYSHPADLAKDLALTNELLTGRRQWFQLQKRYLKKDGSLVWVKITVSSVWDEKSRSQYLIAMIEDISENVTATQALLESEKRYRQLVNQSPDAVIVYSKGKIVYINPAGVQMLGFKFADDLIGKPVLDIIHPDYWDVARQRMQIVSEGRPVSSALFAEEKLVRADGSFIEVEITTTRFTHQEKPAIQAIIHDITHRKAVEQALKASEERYRNLFENVPISLWEQDFSALKTYLDSLRAEGIEDVDAYFSQHPEKLIYCTTLINALDANKASLSLYAAKTKNDLTGSLHRILKSKAMMEGFRSEIVSLFEGKQEIEVEIVNNTLVGEVKLVNVKISVAPDTKKPGLKC